MGNLVKSLYQKTTSASLALLLILSNFVAMVPVAPQMAIAEDSTQTIAMGYFQTMSVNPGAAAIQFSMSFDGIVDASDLDVFIEREDGSTIVKSLLSELIPTHLNNKNAISGYAFTKETPGTAKYDNFVASTSSWERARYYDSATSTIDLSKYVQWTADTAPTKAWAVITNSDNSKVISDKINFSVTSLPYTYPSPSISAVGALYNVKSEYTGIYVEFNAKQINSATDIELRLNDNDGDDDTYYSIHAKQGVLDTVNESSTTSGGVTTGGTVIVTGSRESGSWTNQAGTWSGSSRPVNAEVRITLQDGTVISGFDNLIGNGSGDQEAVFATVPNPYQFPSTNENNKNNNHPYVELVESRVGEVELSFVNDTNSLAFFEYRIDGNVLASGTSHLVVNGDFIYNGVSVDSRGISEPVIANRTFSAGEKVEVRLALDGERDWDFDWISFDALPDTTKPTIVLNSGLANSFNPTNYSVTATDDAKLDIVTAHLRRNGNNALVKSCSASNVGGTNYTLNCVVPADLEDSQYNIRYNARDAVGNLSVTSTAYFTIDNTAPETANFVTPTPGKLVRGETTIEVHIADSSAGLGQQQIVMRKPDNTVTGNWTYNVATGATRTIAGPTPEFSYVGDSHSGNLSLVFNTDNIVDGQHNLRLFTKDTLGNGRSNIYSNFIVDNTAPTATLTFTGGKVIDGKRYVRPGDTIKFTVDASDETSGLNRAANIVFKLKVKDNGGLQQAGTVCGSWHNGKFANGSNTLNGSFKMTNCNGGIAPDDGLYGFAVRVYDNAGNFLRIDNAVYTVDGTKPVVSDFNSPDLTSSTLNLSAKAIDATSGVEYVRFFIADMQNGECKNNYSALAGYTSQVEYLEGDIYNTSLDTSALDGEYCVLVSARDNTTNNSTPLFKKITIDNTAPSQPTVLTPTARQWFKTTPIQNSWSTATDENGVAKYQVGYLYDDGHKFGASTCQGEFINGIELSGCRDEVSTSRNHSPALQEQGGVTIWVRAIDNAGNVGPWSKSVHYYYDYTNPDTDIIVPAGVVGNIFTIKGQANDNLGLNRVYLQLNKSTGGRFGVTTLHMITSPFSLTSDWSHTYSASILGLADGDYRAHASVTDMAGNSTNTGWSGYFTVDTTAPTVEIVSPTTDLTNGDVEFIATVSDANLRHYWYQIKKNGSEIKSETVLSAGIDNKLIATLSEEGAYTITLAARDLAGGTHNSGNRSGNVVKTITIDKTAPEAPSELSYVTTSGRVLEYGDSTNEVSGLFSWSEVSDAVKYGLYTWNENPDSPAHAVDISGKHFASWFTSLQVPGDLTATGALEHPQYACITAVDAAGNESECSEIFSAILDQTAPNAPTINSTSLTEISGDAEANSIVTVFVDNTEVGIANADEHGAWAFIFDPALFEGIEYLIGATATDEAGNTGATTEITLFVESESDEENGEEGDLNEDEDETENTEEDLEEGNEGEENNNSTEDGQGGSPEQSSELPSTNNSDSVAVNPVENNAPTSTGANNQVADNQADQNSANSQAPDATDNEDAEEEQLPDEPQNAEDTENNESNQDIAGARDEAEQNGASTWYWWVAILAALTGGWWIVFGRRKKDTEEQQA